MKAFAPIFLLLLLSSCSVRPLVPIDYTIEVVGSEREALLARLEGESGKLKSYRVLAGATLTQDQRSSSFRYLIAVDGESRVRLEMLPNNAGYPLNLYVSNGSDATFLIPPEHEAYTGDGSLLRRALGVPVSDKDLLSLITGHVAQAVLSDKSLRIFRNSEGVEYILVAQDTRAYWINSDNLDCRQIEIRSDSGRSTLLQVNFSETQKNFDVRLPYQITFTFPDEDTTIKLDVNRADINPILPPRLFKLKIPRDYSVSAY